MSMGADDWKVTDPHTGGSVQLSGNLQVTACHRLDVCVPPSVRRGLPEVIRS